MYLCFVLFLNKVCVFTTQYRNTELDQCSEEGHYETKTVNSDGTTNESKRNGCFHSIDFGPKNVTIILNFWSSKYPYVQVDMLTYIQLYGSITFSFGVICVTNFSYGQPDKGKSLCLCSPSLIVEAFKYSQKQQLK